MKKWFRDIDKRWKEYALAGCVCIVFFALIMNLGGIFGAIGGFFKIISSVVIGFILAYIINPIAVFCQEKLFSKIKGEKIKWRLSVILASIVVLVIVALLVLLLIPQLIDNINSLAENYESYENSLIRFLTNKFGALGQSFVDKLTDFVNSEDGLIEKIGDFLQKNAVDIIATTANVGSVALNWIIGAVFAFYFLMSKKRLQEGLKRLLKLGLSDANYDYVMILGKKFNAIFSEYIVCELVDALIVGVGTYLFMLITKMPDALVISVICGITNLIPTFGPFIGGGIGIFLLLLLKPSAILPFLIWVIVVQAADAYVIKPKLFGDALNVPGLFILIAIIVFGKLMGVTGMLLAIPFAAIIVYCYEKIFIPWL